MGRTNLDPIMTFPDGSHLLISTACSKEGNFSCALYMATIAADDQGAFRVVSNHLAAATCLVAQEDAYSYAQRLYPRSAETMKKPPYLIWPGPAPTGHADVQDGGLTISHQSSTTIVDPPISLFLIVQAPQIRQQEL